MFLIKFLFYFSLSFFILTIPMSGTPLFYSLEKVARPVTENLFSYVREGSKEGIKKSKKFFSNTVPPKRDIIKTRKSSTKKPMGKYTEEEKEFLQNILKKAQ
jgi:hypothetical protein